MRIKNLLRTSAITTCVIIATLTWTSYSGLNSNLLPTLEAGADDAQVINIAGRQRMLTQKMSKEALMVVAGVAGAEQLLKGTRDEFAANLADLTTGNAAKGIAKPPNQKIADDFSAITALWVDFDNAITDVLGGGPAAADGIVFVRANNISLLKASNQAVVDWTAFSGQRTQEMVAASKRGLSLQVWMGAAAALIAVALSVVTARRIMVPLNSAKRLVGAYADGDLTRTTEVRHRDEIGEVTAAINTMGEHLREIISTLGARAHDLQSSSGDIAGSADQSRQNAGLLDEQVGDAAHAFEQLKQGIDNMVVNADEANAAVDSITEAIEEMSASIGDISSNADRERAIADRARGSAAESQRAMAALNESTEQISGVVGIISDIADKTALLALNARIEAARAGQAGSGFTVVANEVKELARQTMLSTKEIADVMTRLQEEASASSAAITQVSDTIYEVTEISDSVSAAVTQQAGTLNDICQSMASANQKIGRVSQDLHGAESEAARINENLLRVAGVASDSLGVAQATQSGAGTISTVSSELAAIVGRFRADRA